MDVLNELSLARTALDEGYAYDGVNSTDLGPEEMRIYVIDRIDNVMRAFDSELAPEVALATIAYLTSEIANELDWEGVGGDGEPVDTTALATDLRRALSTVYAVIEVLKEGGTT